MKQRTICKTLAVAVILLFLGLAVQPSVAITQKEAITVSPLNPDETRYLANLSMDFGENITNDNIEYEKGVTRVTGNWTVNVKITFECPENLKIVVDYEYFAELQLWEQGDRITFCDVEDTVTIINGSNPPDIDINYTQYCFGVWGKAWDLTLRIKANLTAYEFHGGEWVKLHNDDIYNEITDDIDFNRIRPSERTKTSDDDDCNICPTDVSKIRIKTLLNHLEVVTNSLKLRYGHIPEVNEKCEELSEYIDIINLWGFPITCKILVNLIDILMILAGITMGMAILYPIFIGLLIGCYGIFVTLCYPNYLI